jgi:hypothetical protein
MFASRAASAASAADAADTDPRDQSGLYRLVQRYQALFELGSLSTPAEFGEEYAKLFVTLGERYAHRFEAKLADIVQSAVEYAAQDTGSGERFAEIRGELVALRAVGGMDRFRATIESGISSLDKYERVAAPAATR